MVGATSSEAFLLYHMECALHAEFVIEAVVPNVPMMALVVVMVVGI